MAKVGQPYSSGTWDVKAGKEDEFVAAWLEFVGWSIEMYPGKFTPPVLLRDDENPRHFVSIGPWVDAESRAVWRSEPEFKPRIGKCIALCDDFKPHDSTLVATPG